jgi:hypothetical protein
MRKANCNRIGINVTVASEVYYLCLFDWAGSSSSSSRSNPSRCPSSNSCAAI